MGRYIKFEAVRLRLVGKVRFTDNPNEENKMSRSLADRLINEAESQVEQDLSPRYSSPFQTQEDQDFNKLPERPTREILTTLCELKSVIRVLETDFGAGTAVDADKYIGRLEARYKKIVEEKVLAKVENAGDSRQWAFPPLPGLKLNWFNTQADDGYAGMVYVTSQGDGDYPSKQINDPSETFWNSELD